MTTENKFANIVTQMQGQAGVHAVAAQLLIRGHIPSFPTVDHGYDLILENGLRLQVKASRLTIQAKRRVDAYPGYTFNIRKTVMNYEKRARSAKRDWSKIADFFVFWGIDDDRFWIVPVEDIKGANGIRFSRTDPLPQDVTGKIRGGHNLQYGRVMAKKIAYEGRWDLLNTNGIENLIESAAGAVSVPTQGE